MNDHDWILAAVCQHQVEEGGAGAAFSSSFCVSERTGEAKEQGEPSVALVEHLRQRWGAERVEPWSQRPTSPDERCLLLDNGPVTRSGADDAVVMGNCALPSTHIQGPKRYMLKRGADGWAVQAEARTLYPSMPWRPPEPPDPPRE